VNAKRAAMARLSTLAGARPIPISGLDVLLINQIFFYDDPARFTDSVNRVCDELEERTAGGPGVARPDAPRLVFSGCPFAVPNWKLHSIVEAASAAIVGLESCVGERGARNLVDVSGQSIDRPLDSLVDRYLSINCAVFTPNPGRLDHVRRMVSEYGADGVVHYALQFCGPYQIEAGLFERRLEKDGIPVLRVDTENVRP